jgi:hypothetical protein
MVENRLVKPILRDTIQDLDGIKQDLTADIATLVGEDFVEDQDSAMSGIIGNATAKNFEQSELDIKVLNPPE